MTWLERHDDEINLHRFYATEISRDLFGTWLLTRRWGRVGRGDVSLKWRPLCRGLHHVP